MGRSTAPDKSLARGYVDDGTPSGRRFEFELPDNGRPPVVDLPDPPGSATPGRMRRYRSVGRRRGYLHHRYVFEVVPGERDPVDPPTEPALPVVPAIVDPDIPEGEQHRRQRAFVARASVRRHRAATRRGRIRQATAEHVATRRAAAAERDATARADDRQRRRDEGTLRADIEVNRFEARQVDPRRRDARQDVAPSRGSVRWNVNQQRPRAHQRVPAPAVAPATVNAALHRARAATY